MAFTYNPATDRGRVRLLISDTDDVTAANQIFTDAEIDAHLDLGDSEVYQAAANACRSLAALATRTAFSIKVEKVLGIDRKAQPGHWRDLAAQYEEKAHALPVEEWDAFDFDVGAFGVDRSEYIGDII